MASSKRCRDCHVSNSKLLTIHHFLHVFATCRTSFKESRLKEYLDALNVPALTSEEEQAIDEAGSEVHYRRFVSPKVGWLSAWVPRD